MRRLAVTILLALSWCDLARSAEAAFAPTQQVRLIVPYAAGGTNDAIARLIAPKLSEMWRQPVIVENRTGGSGMIAAEAVAKGPADGTMLFAGSNGSITVAPHLRLKMPYDALTDLIPLVNFSSVPSMLVVNPNVPAKTVPEFVAHLKKNPGKFNFSSSGITSGFYLAAELFQMKTGTKMTHIPYTGIAPAEVAVMAGDVECFFDAAMTALPFVQAGRMRALGVASFEPWPLAPEIPLIADIIPGFESSTFVGFFAPAATPPDIVRKLTADLVAVAKSPEMDRRIRELGGVPSLIGLAGDDYRAYLKADSQKWGDLARVAGMEKN